mgnify:CR=1 FL=1
MRRVIGIVMMVVMLGVVGCNVPAATEPTAVPSATLAPTATALPTPTPVPSSAAYPWWRQAVFYQVFVRSFADSTEGSTDCDGIGDINGLIERLDYLNDGDPTTTDDLGVTALWLMPIQQSPSYHGYDVMDYYTVETDYGTNEDFLRLMDEAKARGMHVIVDLVLNHVSSQHPWFNGAFRLDSPTHDYFVWQADPPDVRGEWGQTVWHRLGPNKYYGVFWSGMPDLNYSNPAVTEEMYGVSRFWLEEMGADGFRLDAIRFFIEENGRVSDTPANFEWMTAYQAYLKSVDPQVFTVGEAWTSNAIAARYVQQQGVDMTFAFDQATAIISALKSGTNRQLLLHQPATYTAYPTNQFGTFLTNHDQDRIMSQLGGDAGKVRAAAFWLLTSPGVPFIYYGEEIGMVGVKPDEKIRTPMQWTGERYVGFSECGVWQAPNRNAAEFNVAGQTDDPQSLLRLYRDLIHLRRAHPALLTGEYALVESSNTGVYAFLRTAPDETVLVVLNLTPNVIDDYVLSVDATGLSAVGAVSVLYGEGAAVAPVLDRSGGFAEYVPVAELAPYAGVVVRLGP